MNEEQLKDWVKKHLRISVTVDNFRYTDEKILKTRMYLVDEEETETEELSSTTSYF